MRLIGSATSPYVRRVEVTLRLLDVPFDRDVLSTFVDHERFAAINPVLKAPTLVTDDGVVLMDSTLILEHVERVSPPARPLSPSTLIDHARHQRLLGLALAGCDKTVALVYERTQRPAERQHQPWIDRIRDQAGAALSLLDHELRPASEWLFGDAPMQADVTAAIVWAFMRKMAPEVRTEHDCPALAEFARRAERHPAFRS